MVGDFVVIGFILAWGAFALYVSRDKKDRRKDVKVAK